MSASIIILVKRLPTTEEIAAAAATVELVVERRAVAPGAAAFRGEGTVRPALVELLEDEEEGGGQAAVAVRTAGGRSALDSWRQARLALALLERLDGRLAPGEKLSLDALRELARSAPPGAGPRGGRLRSNLRPLGAAAAMLLATAGTATLIVTGGAGSRYALVFFVMAAVAALLAFAERRARPRR